MRTNLIYDLPTRFFHWIFASLFLLSFVIAKTVDDESVIFSYHMISGIMLGGLIVWRFFWGLFGSKHSRFSDFSLHPIDLKNYFIGILTRSKKVWPGHNPASSWAALSMFILGLGLAVTGYLMSTGNKETFEDAHELFANAFIIIIISHVLGVMFHSFQHRDGIAFSMFDGKKELVGSNESIPSARYFVASVLLFSVVLSGSYLFKKFDPQNRTLRFFGQTLQLGENENNNDADIELDETQTDD